MKEWEQFLSNLTKELGPSVVDLWLKPLRVIRFDAANLYLEAQNPMQVTWFEEYIRPRLRQGFVNENHRLIKVYLTKESGARVPPPKPTPQPTQKSTQKSTWGTVSFKSDPLDPTCTLDNFFITGSNAMSHKLLSDPISIARFNPIFLYGPKGSGKTHLLMSVALMWEKEKKKWLFVTADTFTEHVVQAIRSSNMQEFRKIYRDIDLLIIDDIDQLAKRTATQEEFFHTFNTLHLQGKQIILSSALPPSKLTDIESRLISRFEWGLPIGIGKSPIKNVLELKAKSWKFDLPEELSSFLIEHFPLDPIIALHALVLRCNGPKAPTPAMAKQILGDLLRKEQENSLTPEKVLKALAAHFGITTEDITGKSQTKEYAFPRQIAMYLCRERLKLPFQGIGKLFSRDHSTVMSSVKQIQQEIDKKNNDVLQALAIF